MVICQLDFWVVSGYMSTWLKSKAKCIWVYDSEKERERAMKKSYTIFRWQIYYLTFLPFDFYFVHQCNGHQCCGKSSFPFVETTFPTFSPLKLRVNWVDAENYKSWRVSKSFSTPSPHLVRDQPLWEKKSFEKIRENFEEKKSKKCFRPITSPCQGPTIISENSFKKSFEILRNKLRK